MKQAMKLCLKFAIAALVFAVKAGHSEVVWQEIPVQLPPVQQVPNDYMVGTGAMNPFFTLPLSEIQGKWVRFSGAIDDPQTGMRFVVNTWLDVERKRMAGRVDEARCDVSVKPVRCSAIYWIATDVAAAAAGAWAKLKPGRVYDLKVEVAVAESDPAIQPIVNPVIKIFQDQYFKRNEVNWSGLSNLLAAIPRAPAGQDLMYLAATQIRNRLPDNKHTFVGERTTLLSESDAALPRCAALDATTFTLTLPGMNGTDKRGTQRYAQAIKDCLQALPQPRRWVLDLRGNSGGNMYPMLEGLSSLMDSQDVSFFIDADGKVKNGASLSAQEAFGTRKDLPLVVVLGPRCASSCEAVSLSLSGRSQTLFVGQATAGFTTANIVQPLNEKYFVALTVSWMADPCKNKAPEKLVPAILIEDVNNKTVHDILADPRIETWGLAANTTSSEAERRCAFSADKSSAIAAQ